ncbi:hypothetical protein TRFO_41325 [Tritrichomonas foetus]|uniref:DegT/DnrJ/EryC1/StrS aminotransferase family protein n=1 Tax=Tritrichomonas foetus TaxID=1144522 RepID=A0A1J4L503_9EUKA|nr:hypothetical protein TRFO_41325 [Tritrichomonas foetus]|eukprot:OHT17068.1 hypothetical protein TRFO_41325 [Tritrichomonas foetus]
MFTSFPSRCTQTEVSHINEVLRKGWLAPGDNASTLENEVAKKCGKSNGVLLNSKTSALFIACFASGIHEGVHVLVPAICDQSIFSILQHLRAEIIFYDVSLDSFTLPPDELSKLITDEITHVIISNPLSVKYDYSSLDKVIIIEDLYFSHVENPTTTVSILTFDGVCSLALFSDAAIADRALCTRDWGRVGTQDEDIAKRYDGWELDGVKYDYKFVYGHLGFNFKSCEMSATIALDRFRMIADKVDDFNELRKPEYSQIIKLSENGYSFLVKCDRQDELVARLLAMQVTAHTMAALNIKLAEKGDFPNSKDLYENYMFINRVADHKKNHIVVSAVLDLVDERRNEEED